MREVLEDAAPPIKQQMGEESDDDGPRARRSFPPRLRDASGGNLANGGAPPRDRRLARSVPLDGLTGAVLVHVLLCLEDLDREYQVEVG